ncbi:Hsp70 family protein [Actinoplanes utahensis]|uniref:Hsp70 family protein n=1 Tax=Actinoplanes utahensis TaxID=1869 RepID=UPI0031EE5332
MYALGIDLGTTWTAAATWRDGHAEIVPLGGRGAAIPSVVLLRSDETFLTGEPAGRRGLTEPHRVAREFKRRIGDSTPILLGGVPQSAEALTARMLRAVVEQVATREGGPPSATCVSYPANWGPFKIDLLKQAVRMADLRGEVTYTTEPEAAAVSYAQQQRLETGAVIAVYDLGGGTFDAAVLRNTGLGFDILGRPEGIERLGGIDFDAAVFEHVRAALNGRLEELDEEDTTAITAVARLREECVNAKEALSSDTDTTIPVLLPNVATEVRLTRAEFEAMIRPALYGSVDALKRAVRSAGCEPDALDAILLVGGSSRMPLVAQTVTSEFGRPVAVDAHPKHAVALGAAWLAGGVRAAVSGPAAGRATPPSPRPASSSGPASSPRSVPSPRPASSPGPALSPRPASSPGPASSPRPASSPGPASSPRPASSSRAASSPSPGSSPRPAPGTGAASRNVPAMTVPVAVNNVSPASARASAPASAPSSGSGPTSGSAPASGSGSASASGSAPGSAPASGSASGPGSGSASAPVSAAVTPPVNARSTAILPSADAPTTPRAPVVGRVASRASGRAAATPTPTSPPPRRPAPTGKELAKRRRSRRRLIFGIAAILLTAILIAAGVAYAQYREGSGTGQVAQPSGSTKVSAEPAPLAADEQCTDQIKSNKRWVCLTSAVITGGKLTVDYEADWGGSTPDATGGYHLHVWGGSGGDDHDMGSHVPRSERGEWYVVDRDPSVLDVSDDRFINAIGDAQKVCARIALAGHGLVKDGKSGYQTGNCVKITRR